MLPRDVLSDDTIRDIEKSLSTAAQIDTSTGNFGPFVDQLKILVNAVPRLVASNKALKRIAFEAANLYDNRLGHREDNPLWSAPQDLWKRLGSTLPHRP